MGMRVEPNSLWIGPKRLRNELSAPFWTPRRVDGMSSARVVIDLSQLVRSGGSVDRDLERRAIRVSTKARALCPVHFGRLRASIHQRKVRDLIWEVVADANYAIYVHEGTRPHFPPPQKLERWARLHGFPPGGGFLVARAISEEGTEGRPFLSDALPEAL